MAKYIAKRLAAMLLVFVGLTFAIYVLVSFTPGGNAADREVQTLVGGGTMPTEEQIHTIYAKYGLDKSIPMQYWDWLKSVFTGTWGRSYANLNVTVMEAIGPKIGPTLILSGTGMLLAIVIGVTLGILCALKPNGFVDHLCTVLTFLGSSVPGFLLSIVAIYIFCVKLKWLPSGYNITRSYLECLVLPALISAFVSVGRYIKQTRGSMLDVMNEEYVKTAKAKGLPYRKVVVRHMLRNAAIPIVTCIALGLPHLVGGSVIIEKIFSWPGIGNYMISSLMAKDIPVVMGCVSLTIMVVLVANFILDALYAVLDPTIRGRGR